MPSTLLESEILEQPAVIRHLIESEKSRVKLIVEEIRQKFTYILIAARGTSDNAARYAQYLFGINNHIQVALATPSIFSIYRQNINLKGALVIGISQSGQSPDILSVLAEGRKQGCPTLALTNDPESPLARTAEHVIPLWANPEKAVAASKTYTASLAALALISCVLNDDNESILRLEQIPNAMKKTIDTSLEKISHAERYRFIEHCSVIGRGYNYATAFEIALKIKELTRVVSEPYSSADFRHGPIATAQRGFPIIIIAVRGYVFADLNDLLDELKSRNAERIIISDNPLVLENAQLPFLLPQGVPEWLSPIVAVIPGQLFAMQLATEKGLNADRPEGLTKVTETL